MKTEDLEVSSSRSADNRDEPELPPSSRPTTDTMASGPEFIDETEENSAIIITNVFADKNTK
jgi:hypothetical protein